VAVGAFEEGIAIQFIHVGLDVFENAVNQLAPPAFIVVLARTIDRGPERHLLPAIAERLIQRRRLEPQPDAFADKGVMVPDTLRQVDQRPGGVEEDRFVHAGNYRTGRRVALFAFTAGRPVL
jgi:hypothetical protein